MNMKICGYLPLFPGFYESDFESSDTEYYAYHNDEDYLKEQYGENITEDDFEFDYETRRTDIIDAFIEAYKNYAPDFVSDIKFLSLVSPRYYNFSTDKVDAEITLEDGWREKLTEFLNTDENIAQIIYDNHTSYDGFHSFMENDVQSWIDEISKDEPDERYVIYAIVYYMGALNKGLQELKYSLIYDSLEDIWDSGYLHYKKDDETENE